MGDRLPFADQEFCIRWFLQLLAFYSTFETKVLVHV